MIWVINNNYIIVKTESMKKVKKPLAICGYKFFIHTNLPLCYAYTVQYCMYPSVEGVLFN